MGQVRCLNAYDLQFFCRGWLILAAAPLLACGADPLAGSSETISAELGKTSQALAGYGTGSWGIPVEYWNLNDYVVPVCYLENSINSGIEADYFADFAEANAKVQATAGLTINWEGPCEGIDETELESYVTVIFDDQNGTGSQAAPGFRNRRSNDYPVEYQVGMGVGTNGVLGSGQRFLYGAVHEFLHALGFLHEQQRSDSEAECPAGTADNGNNTEEPGADLLTAYDENSIMNYCRTAGGLGGHLTASDLAGIGFVYPKTFVRTMRGNSMLSISGGMLARSDGYLASDWTELGATDPIVGTVAWGISGVPVGVGSGPRLALSPFSGTLTFGAWMVDFLGRSHSFPNTSITINNVRHAALVNAAVMVMNRL